MQIQSTQVAQPSITQPANSHNASSTSSTATTEPGVQVSISNQAQQLAQVQSASVQSPVQIQPVPNEPQSPLSGEQLDKAVQIKKAQMHYNATSEMANIVNAANGSNDDKGISVAGAYYLSQNEDARDSALSIKSQQQNMQNMQAYQDQTAALNEQYS